MAYWRTPTGAGDVARDYVTSPSAAMGSDRGGMLLTGLVRTPATGATTTTGVDRWSQDNKLFQGLQASEIRRRGLEGVSHFAYDSVDYTSASEQAKRASPPLSIRRRDPMAAPPDFDHRHHRDQTLPSRNYSQNHQPQLQPQTHAQRGALGGSNGADPLDTSLEALLERQRRREQSAAHDALLGAQCPQFMHMAVGLQDAFDEHPGVWYLVSQYGKGSTLSSAALR